MFFSLSSSLSPPPPPGLSPPPPPSPSCFEPHLGQNFVPAGISSPQELHLLSPTSSSPFCRLRPHSGQKDSLLLTMVPHSHLMRSPPSCAPSRSFSYSPPRILL